MSLYFGLNSKNYNVNLCHIASNVSHLDVVEVCLDSQVSPFFLTHDLVNVMCAETTHGSMEPLKSGHQARNTVDVECSVVFLISRISQSCPKSRK